MYCPACGMAVSHGLSYCNYCGAKLNAEKNEVALKSSELRAESMIISGMIGLFVLGLLAIAVLIGVMKAVLGLDQPLIIAFTMLSFLIMLLIEGVLVRQLWRKKRGAEAIGDGALAKGQTTRELNDAQARVLSPEGAPSVTEHTTRAFEPVYVERKSE